MPTTRQPAAASNRATSCPTSPSPITPTVSPSPTSAWRTPWSAIAPTVAYAASSNETPSGIGRDEVLRHGEDLGVVRALAAAGDPVARRDAVDALADLEHDPGGRVADRRERVEPVARRVERGADPLDARLVHDLLDEVGAGARLLEQVLLARDDLRPLGAGADQRRAVRDEQPAGLERRGRHVDDADGAVLRALGDLFHCERSLAGPSAGSCRADRSKVSRHASPFQPCLASLG